MHLADLHAEISIILFVLLDANHLEAVAASGLLDNVPLQNGIGDGSCSTPIFLIWVFPLRYSRRVATSKLAGGKVLNAHFT